ncbi:MAG: transcription initiation factor IIB family protein [Candidatus Hodarchaeota archaeon]
MISISDKGKKETANEVLCSACHSQKLYVDNQRGEIVCGECGTVVTKRILSAARTYQGTGAYIPKPKTPKTMAAYRKIQRLQRQLQASRTLISATREVQRITSQLDVPELVRKTAISIGKKAVNRGLARGRSAVDIAAGSVLIAARLHKMPVSHKEITKVSKIPTEEKLGKVYRSITRALKIKIPVPKSSHFVSQLASKLGLSMKVQTEAYKTLKRLEGTNISHGRDPRGIAGAAIYIASIVKGERRTQSEVSRATGITEVTLRKRYKELVQRLQLKLT